MSQQLWLGQYRDQRRPIEYESLQRWIAHGNYRIETTPTLRQTTLFSDGSLDIVEAMSADVVRFSSAALESIHALETLAKRPKATSWIIIRTYYAAYFAANTIMRLFGHFCTNIDTQQVAAINQMALIYGVTLPASTARKQKLAPGTYLGCYVEADGLVTMKSLHNVNGGAHKQFWFAFHEFLDSLPSAIKASSLPTSDKNAATKSVTSIKKALCQGTNQGGGWLSEMRNAVNYRLEFGTWHPYESSQVESQELLERIYTRIKSDADFNVVLSNQSELLRCAELSASLVAWMTSSLERMSLVSRGGNKHFLTPGVEFRLECSGR